MSQVNPSESMDRIVDILASIRTKGVSLWSANGQLHFKGPRSALAPAEIEALRLSKAQLIALLECSAAAQSAELRLEARPVTSRTPLTLSQLGRWRSCFLHERTTLRQVADAMRLCGRLNVGALRRSITEIVRRHEALRTRIVVSDGLPTQDIAAAWEYDLEVRHSTELEVQHAIEELILEPITVATGPLFEMRLLRLCDTEHILLVAMEHIISDGFSLNVLWRDLFAAYNQAMCGQAFSLPEVSIQLADYAVWQKAAQQSWFETHTPFWNHYLAGCQRLTFPNDPLLSPSNRRGWGTVKFEISAALKAQLCELCKVKRTTLATAIFTAYAALALRWCKASEGVFQYPIDGRTSPAIQNTIGFFASMLYLRIQTLEDDCFIDLMSHVTREYCRVYEHADPHDLSARIPAPDFTRTTLFNWVPRMATQTSSSEAGDVMDGIRCTSVPFEHPIGKTLDMDSEPAMNLFDTEGGTISGEVTFPLNRFSVATMERFAHNMLLFVKSMVHNPGKGLRDILLV